MSRVGFPAIGMILLLFFNACGGGSSGTPSPIVTMSISPSSIPAGQSATLTWSSTNSSSCAASGAWTGSQPTSGSLGVSPAAPGTFTYTLSCSSSGSSAANASATLTVTPPPLAITTPALANGVVGTSYSETIQATNGVGPFVWTVSSGPLPPNLSLSTSTTSRVTLSGIPESGTQGTTFTIQVTDATDQVATQAYTVSILLQADSLTLSPATLDFATGLVANTSAVLTETLTNTANLPVVINGIAIAGPNATEFQQTSTTCQSSLAAGSSCAVSVNFTPGQVGLRTAALTISDDTVGSPQSVTLTGTGLTAGPNATLSTDSLPFGTQRVGTTSPARSVSLTNYGTETLNVVHIAATATFAETDDCVPSLASRSTCTINVTFTPGASGGMTGTLSISDDAPGNPKTVPLSGIGSTNTPLLTGYCFATCFGRIKDYANCPVGQPSDTPSYASIYPCGPISVEGGVPVDAARRCLVRAPNRFGHCVTQ